MLMSQPRQFQPHHGGGQFNDTTMTKIFVGGLAWETQRDTMRKYFEQFGEILEAVVITDKATGRSKGYGFVTFKNPDSAFRACQNPAPVIDGRKANCNLASLGAQKNRPPTAAAHQGQGWFRAGMVAPPAAAAAAAFSAAASPYFQLQQSAPQLTFPYSAYGYSGFSHDTTTMYPMSYYGVYGGQNLSPFYTTGAAAAGGGGGGGSGAGGYFHNYYPYYGAYAASQGSQAQQQHGGYGVHQYHHPHMLQYSSFLPGQHQHSSGILALPPPPPPISSGNVAIMVAGGNGGTSSAAVSENNSTSA